MPLLSSFPFYHPVSSLWVTAQTYVYENNTSIKAARGDWLSCGVNDGRLIISCDTDDSSMFTLAHRCPEGRKTQVTRKEEEKKEEEGRRNRFGNITCWGRREREREVGEAWLVLGNFLPAVSHQLISEVWRTLVLNDVGTVIHHRPGLGSSLFPSAASLTCLFKLLWDQIEASESTTCERRQDIVPVLWALN